ncbi:MAG: hypothetical protein ACPG31_04930 [Planctomycetota bacterium]
MRKPFPIFLLLALLPGACQTCPPETRALVLAPNYRTAEDGGRSFLAAFSCDDSAAEYLCLGEALKETYGATMDLYLLARPEIREQLGRYAGQAWRLEPTRTVRAEPGVVVWWGLGEREVVGLLMQQQYFFDVHETDGRRVGSILDRSPGDLLQIRSKSLLLELTDPALRSVGPPESISGFELGTEWKIADFLFPEEEA